MSFVDNLVLLALLLPIAFLVGLLAGYLLGLHHARWTLVRHFNERKAD